MNRALLVIDVQESFRARKSWELINHSNIAERCNRLVAAARKAGDLVIWVLHAEPGSGDVFDPASGNVRLLEPLQPADGEPVITKTSHNAFTTTNLQQLLTSHGIGEIVISGIRTEQCCETTARVGSDLGYRVTFVVDATATQPLAAPGLSLDRDFDQVINDPRTLPAESVVERTVYALAGRFATITSLDDFAGSPIVA
ncbi:MAG: cysteine hydrolase [Microlunatus sp.]|nr:cysteine hydrolase [Microlunatus sp.]